LKVARRVDRRLVNGHEKGREGCACGRVLQAGRRPAPTQRCRYIGSDESPLRRAGRRLDSAVRRRSGTGMGRLGIRRAGAVARDGRRQRQRKNCQPRTSHRHLRHLRPPRRRVGAFSIPIAIRRTAGGSDAVGPRHRLETETTLSRTRRAIYC
jgi:hypothetical protein